jgi:hypothetical protein
MPSTCDLAGTFDKSCAGELKVQPSGSAGDDHVPSCGWSQPRDALKAGFRVAKRP